MARKNKVSLVQVQSGADPDWRVLNVLHRVASQVKPYPIYDSS